MEYTTTNNIDNKKKYLIDLFDELNVNLKFSFSERPVEAKEVIDKIQRVRMQIESAIETMKYSPKPNFIKVSDNFVKIYNTFHKSLEELILSFHRDLQEERKIELKNDVVMMIDRIKTIIIFEDD